MSTAQRVIGNTMWLYLRMGVSIVVNVFTSRILLEALGASDFGLYNVVGGAITMLGFLSSAMASATQRFLNVAEGEGHPERIKQIFNNAVAIHRGLALFVVLFLAAAGFFFFNGILNIPPDRENVAVAVYVCMLVTTVYGITITPYDAVLNAHENMRYYSILGIGDVVFKFVIAICVAVYGYDRLLFYAVLMAVESWGFRTVTQIYCRHRYSECRKVVLRENVNRSTIKRMAGFAKWNLLGQAASIVSLFGMNVVVNHYFDTNVNAAMGIATQLSGVIMALSMNMIKALSPVLMKSEGAGQKGQVVEISYLGCKFSYLLFSFVCIPVLLWVSTVLNLWLRQVPDWTEAFCVILIVGTLVEQLTVFLYQSICATGHIRNFSIWRSLTNFLSLLTSITLFAIGGFGPYWALLSWCFCKAVFGGAVMLVYSIKLNGIKISSYAGRVLLPCVAVSAIVSIVGYALKWLVEGGLAVNLASILILIIVSVPIYWLVPLNSKERAIFKGLYLKILHR